MISRTFMHGIVLLSACYTQLVVAEEVPSPTDQAIDSIAEYAKLPIVSLKEIECLAKNIYYEAGSEPIEGKVAVGMVTLNRAQDYRFGKNVCQVVKQRALSTYTRRIIQNVRTNVGYIKRVYPITTKSAICQFSWQCTSVRPPTQDAKTWQESQQVARTLLQNEDNYGAWRDKYSEVLYFHAKSVRPAWTHKKQFVTSVGLHRFYADRE